MSRIHLSPPDMSDAERSLLLAAFDSNWIAPAGPDLAEFEREFSERLGVDNAVAVSSGTAALHLALVTCGVSPGDVVIVPSLTFAATANAVHYVGAEPWFVDSERSTWNVDPALVGEALDDVRRAGRRVGAVVTVDLYGQCADNTAIRALCDSAGVVLIEDAAEAVGATWQGSSAGTFGDVGIFSFNGNKLLTTGGGGMFVSPDPARSARARHLSTQAREPVAHYEHREVGFNYRMSNLLAAVGRGQLRRLDELLSNRRRVHDRYVSELGALRGVSFAPVDARGEPNHWLTVMLLDGAETDPSGVIAALDEVDAEARPTWKPMHLQPVFATNRRIGGEVAEYVFAHGVCLPSGSALTFDDQTKVIEAAHAVLGGG